MNQNQQPYEPGFHNIQPGQKCRILTLQIAVPADADPNNIYDEMSGMLTGAVAEGKSNILDWRYATEYMPEVTADEHPAEGEIFNNVDIPVQAIVTGNLRKALQDALAELDRVSKRSLSVDYQILSKIKSALALAQTPTINAYVVIYDDGSGWCFDVQGNQEDRDNALANLLEDGQVEDEDDIVYVNFEGGSVKAVYYPCLDEIRKESEGK